MKLQRLTCDLMLQITWEETVRLTAQKLSEAETACRVQRVGIGAPWDRALVAPSLVAAFNTVNRVGRGLHIT